MPSNDELPDVEFDIPSCVEHGEFDLSCSDCVALLPELTATEKASMSSLGEDFISRLFLATAIAEDLVEKDLIPEDATSNVASAICSYLNKRVLVKSTLAMGQAGEQAITAKGLKQLGFEWDGGEQCYQLWTEDADGSEQVIQFYTDRGIMIGHRIGEVGGFTAITKTMKQLTALLSALGIEVKHAS